MFVENLCPPAILYLGFSLTQIIIDLFRNMYNTAMVKIAVAVVFTTVLNMLCKSGLTVISWFIVFIPFVTMTLVTGLLLYMFGLGPFTGKMDYSKLNGDDQDQNPAVDRGMGPQDPKFQQPELSPLPTPPSEPTLGQTDQKLPSLASTFMTEPQSIQKPMSVTTSTKKPTFESSLTESASPVTKVLKTVETTNVDVTARNYDTNTESGSKTIETVTTTTTFN
jgi:hypothetical protein